MTWEDALQVGLVVIGSLGGGGVIVFGLSAFIGRLWADRAAETQRLLSEQGLTKLRGEVEAGLRRLDAALGHRSYLLQRFAEMELEALRECWMKARACLPAINGPRAVNSGTDLEDLNRNVERLRVAHNDLMEAIGKHEPFLPDAVSTLVEQIRQKASLELMQIGSRKAFETGGHGDDWWDQGAKNQEAVRELTEALRILVKGRIAELTADRLDS